MTRRRKILVGLGAATSALLIVAAATTSGCASLGSLSTGVDPARLAKSPAWKHDHFENLEHTDVMRPGRTWAVFKEWVRGTQEREPKHGLPAFDRTRTVLATPPSSELRLTWFGHSSVLVELDGARVLTDPIWSMRASPSTVVGPKRYAPPAAPLEALGPIDVVLISHDHYDHLDMATVKQLASRGVRFCVPLGIAAHLRTWHVPEAQITELDWWQSFTLPNGVTVTSVPSKHFCGRFVSRGKTLWTSWVVAGPTHRLFFSGDTGLHEQMAAIAQRLGPFDVAMLEIGQWHPSWGEIHLGPDGAMEAFARLGAKALLPVHWGAFTLGLHGWAAPAETVYRLGKQRGAAVMTPMLGEPIEPATWVAREPWWHGLGGYDDAN